MCSVKFLRGIVVAGLTTGFTVAAPPADAEPWPQRTVRIIVPIGAGSAPDVAARLYAERLTAKWKRPVVVENRPGADGLIGVTAFVSMQDDHALLFSFPAPISVFPFLQEKLAYDPARDLVPISAAMDTFGVISASASLNIRSLAEFVTVARAQPGKLNWAGGGGAFPTLLAGFAKTTGIELAHISYREQNLAFQDLSEGRIQVLASTLTALIPLARSGKVRLLAITNKKRAPFVAEIPTVAEAGHPILEFEGGSGFFGGRSMANDLRDEISADIRSVAADPVLVERLFAAGQIARGSTAAEFAAAIDEQRAKMAAIVKLIGTKPPQ
jgi:tripartite-type tricarboxylate transporter receptor subunit TctC